MLFLRRQWILAQTLVPIKKRIPRGHKINHGQCIEVMNRNHIDLATSNEGQKNKHHNTIHTAAKTQTPAAICPT
jgi:hypothetical protein